jgi:RNA polymerase sigma-70 factor (ECF subfamily)
MTFDVEGPLSRESELELMQALVAGDEDAIRALYGRFGRSVYSLGIRLLRSTEAAEELTQDVFLTAWRKAARFDPARGRLSTWLMAIAHNLAVDRLRHERGAARPVLVLVEDVPESMSTVEEDRVLDRDRAVRALASLSVAERRLLSQAYFMGWTAREIAEAEGIPLGTVKTRLRAAIIKLRASGTTADPAAVAALAEGVTE